MKKLILLFFMCSFKIAMGQSISIKGSWYVKIDPNLIPNAGLDYDPNLRIQSLPNQTIFNLENTNLLSKPYAGTWRVDVQKVDSNWPAELKIGLQRTSSGKSPNLESIKGGTFFQNLSSNPETFIYGKGLVSDVYFQYSLSGLSVLIPVDTYATSVVFTLIEE
jgi:hypothetical protein